MAYKTVNGKMVKVGAVKAPAIAKWTKAASTTTKYGKLVMENVRNVEDEFYGVTAVRLYRANQLSLDNYSAATGGLPYEVEFMEELGLRINDQVFGDSKQMEVGSWRDHILVITKKDGKDYAYGFRVAYDNKSKSYNRPAYGDQVTMTALEAGLARMALCTSHVAEYAHQLGEGDRKVVRVSAMSYVNRDEMVDAYGVAKFAAASLGMMNVYRFLD